MKELCHLFSLCKWHKDSIFCVYMHTSTKSHLLLPGCPCDMIKRLTWPFETQPIRLYEPLAFEAGLALLPQSPEGKAAWAALVGREPLGSEASGVAWSRPLESRKGCGDFLTWRLYRPTTHLPAVDLRLTGHLENLPLFGRLSPNFWAKPDFSKARPYLLRQQTSREEQKAKRKAARWFVDHTNDWA